MEELKLLVESIAGLPDLAIWVVAMYFFFKLAIVGSIFGVIRLAILKIYASAQLKYQPTKTIIEEKETIRNVYNVTDLYFGNYIISGVSKRAGEEVERLLKGMINESGGYKYIHDDEVNELREFIDKYLDGKKVN